MLSGRDRRLEPDRRLGIDPSGGAKARGFCVVARRRGGGGGGGGVCLAIPNVLTIDPMMDAVIEPDVPALASTSSGSAAAAKAGSAAAELNSAAAL